MLMEIRLSRGKYAKPLGAEEACPRGPPVGPVCVWPPQSKHDDTRRWIIFCLPVICWSPPDPAKVAPTATKPELLAKVQRRRKVQHGHRCGLHPSVTSGRCPKSQKTPLHRISFSLLFLLNNLSSPQARLSRVFLVDLSLATLQGLVPSLLDPLLSTPQLAQHACFQTGSGQCCPEPCPRQRCHWHPPPGYRLRLSLRPKG